MPITPHFEISQTDDHVQIDIHVPHVRVSADSLHVVLSDDNRCVHFASPPYLLIATFQHAFEENAEDSCAQYDPLRQHGRVVLKLSKAVRGVYWEDLDMVGALMKPRTNWNQFLQEQQHSPQKSTWIKEVLKEDTSNEMDEEPVESLHDNQTTISEGYGFAKMFRGIFTDLARDGLAREMLEIPLDSKGGMLRVLQAEDADKESPKTERRDMEASKFDPDRYLQDLSIEDDYLYQTAMQMRPHWRDNRGQQSTTSAASAVYFTAQESAQLASIPYPLLPPVREGEKNFWLGVVDLLFAYCYDHLLTDGDPTVESAWNVSILSCSLSWLESFDSGETVADVVSQSIRRSLIYPYLRSIEFAAFVAQQVSYILRHGGRRCVIRCLLQLRSILDQSELYYLGNKLYIDPYLAWLQDSRRHNDDYIITLAAQVDNLLNDSKILKERIGLSLAEIEKEIEKEACGESDDLSSNGSSGSDSSDEDESSAGSASNEGGSHGLCDAGQSSKEFLDTNGNQSSLLLDMSKLSLSGGDSQPKKQARSGKLIEELN